MPWAKFTKAFDWRHPKFRQVTSFKEGYCGLVSQACLNEAKAKDAAIEVERWQRPTPVLKDSES